MAESIKTIWIEDKGISIQDSQTRTESSSNSDDDHEKEIVEMLRLKLGMSKEELFMYVTTMF